MLPAALVSAIGNLLPNPMPSSAPIFSVAEGNIVLDSFHGHGFDTTICNGDATFPAPAPGDTLWAELVLHDSGLVYRSSVVVGPSDSVAYSVSIADSLLFVTWKEVNPFFVSVIDSIAFLDQTSQHLLDLRWPGSSMSTPDLVLGLAPQWRSLPAGAATMLQVTGLVTMTDTFVTSTTRLGGPIVFWDRNFSKTQSFPLR